MTDCYSARTWKVRAQAIMVGLFADRRRLDIAVQGIGKHRRTHHFVQIFVADNKVATSPREPCSEMSKWEWNAETKMYVLFNKLNL